ALRHSWRKAAGFTDLIAPGCDSCRVGLDVDVCRYACAGEVGCPVAKGRFRLVFRAALRSMGENKEHLIGAVERLAVQEGGLARLHLEKAKLIKDGKSLDEIKIVDNEIAAAGKLASKYARECGVAAHVAGGKEPEYDASVFN